MPEKILEKTVFSLSEVAVSIKKTLTERYRSAYWVRAEMNKLNHYSRSGHCYPDLVEKEKGKITAQLRAIIWRDDYKAINRRFQEVLNEPLADGIKIMFLARITFDPVYGLSLRILDIDPSFTLGDLEKEKKESIDALKREGIFYQNKQHHLPLLPRRVAVISVETSKGYADFTKVLRDNPRQYPINHILFPSLLQGEQAVRSITQQLRRIRKLTHHFDLVAIIRGGGGDIGLSAYNRYELAREIARFPLPVFTGIGHATNETVAEMVAHSNLITPTKLAETLIQYFNDFSAALQTAEKKLHHHASRRLQEEKQHFNHHIQLFRSETLALLRTNRSGLKEQARTLTQQSRFVTRHARDYALPHQLQLVSRHSTSLLQDINQKLELLQEKCRNESLMLLRQQTQYVDNLQNAVRQMDPVNVLKRGYSITRSHGKAIKEAGSVKQGDILETVLYNGTIQSQTITSKEPDHE